MAVGGAVGATGLREGVRDRQIGAEQDFRWQGTEVSRLEGFSDTVFGFAVTLLVVSLEVPNTFDQLLDTMRGFAAFAICFLVLLTIWSQHYRFSRRYGLQDGPTRALNAVLLFIVVFYIYLLKFLFTVLVKDPLGQGIAVREAGG